jgi:hypothetical protein
MSRVEGSKSAIRTPDSSAPPNLQPSTLNLVLWVLLPACASVLLLATTNKMCQEVAVIPFLWVLPLALYLLSFILCFDSPRWYARPLFVPALTVAGGGICWMLLRGAEAPLRLQLGLYSAGLFVCCMVCHGELYRLKPDPSRLTGYYLMIAAGGALGGFFVAVVAPLIFNDYFELPWGLWLCVLLFLVVSAARWSPTPSNGWRRLTRSWLAAMLVALTVALWWQTHPASEASFRKSRNFYGVLTVAQHVRTGSDLRYLDLIHGHVLHGMQFADPPRAFWPTAYYGEESGAGLLLRNGTAGQRRIGVIGLGVGTLATYAQKGDSVRIYEINPDVLKLANSRFTFLSNCPARVELTPGDARLSLERESPQQFDRLVIDAFNSDAIPVHLLTREAFFIYNRHLKTNGVIAVHITNRSLNLEPVLAGVANEFGYHVAVVEHTPAADNWWLLPSVWVLLSHDEALLDAPAIHLAARPMQTNSVPARLWTDDFASLFPILRSNPAPQEDPVFTQARCQTAYGLYQQGDFAGAIACFRSALKSHPRSPDLLSNLAFVLATCPNSTWREVPEAVRLAERACELTHYRSTILVGMLAAVYAEAGRFDDAVWMAQKACAQAEAAGDVNLLQKNREMLASYLQHRPYRESAGSERPGPSTR